MAYRKHIYGEASRIKWLVLAGLLTTLLAACGDDTAAPPPVATKKSPAVAAKPVDPTAQMSHAVAVGKTNAPVDLKYDILASPLVGQNVEIDLAVIPTLSADSIGIVLAGSSGLTVMGESVASTESVKSGEPEHFKVTVKASKEDVYYLTVTATVYAAGTSSPKVFAIPVIVGPTTPAISAPAAVTAKPNAVPKK